MMPMPSRRAVFALLGSLASSLCNWATTLQQRVENDLHVSLSNILEPFHVSAV